MSLRIRAAAALTLLLPLVLSGCTVTPIVRVDSGSTQQRPTTAAGRYYLDTICPRNAAVYAYNRVWTSHDLGILHRVAAAASLASAKAAAGLRATDAPWPVSVRTQVELLAESIDLDERSYGELASAPTLQATRAVRWPGRTSAGNARFVIRAAIGLGDGVGSDDCVGHYAGTGTADAAGTT